MSDYFIGFKTEDGNADHIVITAASEEEARAQFWKWYSGCGFRILCCVDMDISESI